MTVTSDNHELADRAGSAAQDVMGTATDQAQNVKEETVRQARNLAAEGRDQVYSQAQQQSQRLSGILRDLGDELRGMADGGNSGHTATELVHQASERAHQLAGYLESKEPSELISDLRSYASRRPGAFLAGAAVLGVVAGRLGRGVKDASSSSSNTGTSAPQIYNRPSTPPPAITPVSTTYSSVDVRDIDVEPTTTSAADIDPLTGGWIGEPEPGFREMPR